MEVDGMREEPKDLMRVDPGAVAAAESAKARIQSAFIMAMKNPRSVDEARARILASCRRTEFAKTVEYNKPMAGTRIKGKTIRFAEEAARGWHNILTSTYVVHEDEERRRTTIIVTDLEANINHSQEIVVTKTVERKKPGEDREILGERLNSEGDRVYIVRATDEEFQSKENSQISKILRNEILRMIPSDIQEEAVAEARKTLATQDKQDPAAAKKQILDSFQTIGLWPKDIEAYLRHKVDNLSPNEIQDLREVYSAIKNGEATWRDYMEDAREKGGSTGSGDEQGKKKGDELSEEDKAGIKRFDEAVAKSKEIPMEIFQKYLDDSAKRLGQGIDRIKIMALGDWKAFWEGFNRFLKRQRESSKGPAGTTAGQAPLEKKTPPAATEGPEAGPASGKKEPSGPAQQANGQMVKCPERENTQMTEKFCRTSCFMAEECKPYQALLGGRK